MSKNRHSGATATRKVRHEQRNRACLGLDTPEDRPQDAWHVLEEGGSMLTVTKPTTAQVRSHDAMTAYAKSSTVPGLSPLREDEMTAPVVRESARWWGAADEP